MRAQGIDISKYDLSFDPTKATKPIDFVVQRASYGITQDQMFDSLLPGVQKVPMRLAYHYLSSGVDLTAQLNKFLTVTQDKGFHAYVCDFESAFNTMSTQFAVMAWNFCKQVVVSTGKRCAIYTNYYHYKDYLVPSQAQYNINWNLVDLWIAQYPEVPNPEGEPNLPPGRTAGWNLWQYTAKGNGAEYGLGRTTAADLDVFNGDVPAMRQWLGLPAEEPTPPTENPKASFSLTVGGVTYTATDVELKPTS